jgi:hypothetical protein
MPFQYIRRCLSTSQKPELMLMSREALYKNLPKNTFTLPSYVKRGLSLRCISLFIVTSVFHDVDMPADLLTSLLTCISFIKSLTDICASYSTGVSCDARSLAELVWMRLAISKCCLVMALWWNIANISQIDMKRARPMYVQKVFNPSKGQMDLKNKSVKRSLILLSGFYDPFVNVPSDAMNTSVFHGLIP